MAKYYDMQMLAMGYGYEYTNGETRLPWRLWLIKELICATCAYPRFKYLEWVCKRKGHDIEDESYGGPDFGYDAGTCRRCGFSYHHNMY